MEHTGEKSMKRFTIFVLLILALAVAVPALADSAEVTQGEFATYASGFELGYTVSGSAHMTRTAAGTTLVSVQVKGLLPNTAYGVHVHNKACTDANGGGHYMHDSAGGVNPENEIWPLFTTNAAGIGSGFASHAYRARPEAQSIVVHAPGGARIACADLTR
jgi:Cu/Zn superoxide dismutase